MLSILALLATPLALLREKPAPVEVVKPDPRSIDGLIAWLETKEPNGSYDPKCHVNCLLVQYTSEITGKRVGWLQSSDFTSPFIDGRRFTAYGDKRGKIADVDFTYGAALQRARAYKAANP